MNSIHKTVLCKARGRLRAVGLEPMDSRRVVLSSGPCSRTTRKCSVVKVDQQYVSLVE